MEENCRSSRVSCDGALCIGERLTVIYQYNCTVIGSGVFASFSVDILRGKQFSQMGSEDADNTQPAAGSEDNDSYIFVHGIVSLRGWTGFVCEI